MRSDPLPRTASRGNSRRLFSCSIVLFLCAGVFLNSSSAQADTLITYGFTGTLANGAGTVTGMFSLDLSVESKIAFGETFINISPFRFTAPERGTAPEPASLLLVGVGLLVAGVVAKILRRNQHG
jgi:PEP-CTERM motif